MVEVKVLTECTGMSSLYLLELLPVTGEGRSTNGLLTLTYYAAADGKEEEIAAQ